MNQQQTVRVGPITTTRQGEAHARAVLKDAQAVMDGRIAPPEHGDLTERVRRKAAELQEEMRKAHEEAERRKAVSRYPYRSDGLEHDLREIVDGIKVPESDVNGGPLEGFRGDVLRTLIHMGSTGSQAVQMAEQEIILRKAEGDIADYPPGSEPRKEGFRARRAALKELRELREWRAKYAGVSLGGQ